MTPLACERRRLTRVYLEQVTSCADVALTSQQKLPAVSPFLLRKMVVTTRCPHAARRVLSDEPVYFPVRSAGTESHCLMLLFSQNARLPQWLINELLVCFLS